MRSVVKSTLTRLPGVSSLGGRILGGPVILMYHRFSEHPVGDGHTVDRATCEWQFRMLARRATVWSLGAYFEALDANRPLPRNLVVITVDDGYRDFYEIAFPLLRSLGLPATFFPVTELIEGRIWLWPDALRWLLENAPAGRYEIETAAEPLTLALGGAAERERTWTELCAFCMRRPSAETGPLLETLQRRFERPLPVPPPEHLAPCSWTELAEMHAAGIELGGHSMTHPILSQVDAAMLDWEVGEPRRVFRERLGIELGSFCYPNGQEQDLNDEVVRAVERAGYRGAVVTQRKAPDFRRYTTSRVGTSVDPQAFLWKALGWEQGLARLRYGVRR